MFDEIKEYTNEQLLGGLALAVMNRLECNDIYVELKKEVEWFEKNDDVRPIVVGEFEKAYYALKYAHELEAAYVNLLKERGCLKMSSEKI